MTADQVMTNVTTAYAITYIFGLVGLILEDLMPTPQKLPPRRRESCYVRPPIEDQTFVPDIW